MHDSSNIKEDNGTKNMFVAESTELSCPESTLSISILPLRWEERLIYWNIGKVSVGGNCPKKSISAFYNLSKTMLFKLLNQLCVKIGWTPINPTVSNIKT